MQEFIVRCETCGKLILQPYDKSKVQRCPKCGRTASLSIVDLAERPDVLRRLSHANREPVSSRHKDAER
jgi:phage FluMu protein Com